MQPWVRDETLTPVQILAELRSVREQLKSAPNVKTEAFADWKRKDREFRQAKNRALVAASGPMDLRKAQAELATDAEWIAADDAQILHDHAVSEMRSLEKQLSSLQTERGVTEGLFQTANWEPGA
ncbi:hypothetical protein [Corynebacterium variabile]|uniref:hypothetical protein n=1 Tax=Corynebacterium variabile TaxID=1727 RepID=UPI003A8C9672